MKNFSKLFFVLCLVFGCCFCVYADNLYSLKTEHFEIIYQLESAPTAKLIYENCESVFDSVSSMIGNIGEDIFIPVAIRSDVKPINAYYTGYPYHTIVLYDTFDGPNNNLNYRNKMLNIFEHELTHALVFNHKDKFWQSVGNIFCDGFTIQGLYVHPMFSEGVCVYSESRNGTGRLQDNFFLHKIKQAKVDGNFPTWYQALGGIDFGNFRDSAYSFGGPFVGFLAERFGEDKLSEFFTQSSSLKFKTMPRFFNETFGISIEEAWNDFYKGIALPDNLINGKVLSKSGNYCNLTKLKNKLYCLNKTYSRIDVYNMDSKEFFSSINSSGADNLSVSADGTMMLGFVGDTGCWVRYLSNTGYVIKTFQSYYQGFKLLPSVFLLVRNEAGTNYIDIYKNYTELYDSICLGYGTDVSCFADYNEDYVSFLIQNNGQYGIGLLKKDDFSLSVVELPSDIRVKSVSGDSFTWAKREASADFVRYGQIKSTDDGFKVVLSQQDFNGGTWFAVVHKNQVFYEAQFSNDSKLCYANIDDGVTLDTAFHDFVGSQGISEEYNLKKFNSFPYLFTGTFIPVGLFSDIYETGKDVLGFGGTYISKDPFDRWNLMLSSGYSISKNSLFAETHMKQKLSMHLSLEEFGSLNYKFEDKQLYGNGTLTLSFDSSVIGGFSYGTSVFADYFYNGDKAFNIGADVYVSKLLKRGPGPLEYRSGSVKLHTNYDIVNKGDLNFTAKLSYHVPRLFNFEFYKNKITRNFPIDLRLSYTKHKEVAGSIETYPFILEIQNGWTALGLFFNRFSTSFGAQIVYDFEDQSLRNDLFTGIYMTFTPVVGMACGNVFGSLNFIVKLEDFQKVSTGVNFSFSY